MAGPLDRNIRPKRAEFKKALAESKQKKAAAAASGVSLVELRDYSEKRKEFVEEYGEELVSDAEKFVRKKEESIRTDGQHPADFRYDLELRLQIMDSWLKREKAKQNRISGSGFKKKKENADKGIDQQSDQNFLLQNYSKFSLVHLKVIHCKHLFFHHLLRQLEGYMYCLVSSRQIVTIYTSRAS